MGIKISAERDLLFQNLSNSGLIIGENTGSHEDGCLKPLISKSLTNERKTFGNKRLGILILHL